MNVIKDNTLRKIVLYVHMIKNVLNNPLFKTVAIYRIKLFAPHIGGSVYKTE
ncbi:hypothetical protein [Plasmodium yoelii yoelii]|uniref:Uncharacterized protein n=1 Tax=Plasmodium yoelii yoelii TaxID=73239 RepID=Q7R9K2_PLAYO|nr:hypothetical protein [Plasmodium yoelii yoelii]